MTFAALTEAEGRLKAAQDDLASIFTEAGPDLNMDNVKSISGSTTDKVAEIRARNAKCDDLGAEVEGLRSVEQASKAAAQRAEKGKAGSGTASGADGRDGGSQGQRDSGEAKSFGELFTGSQAFKGWRPGGAGPAVHLDTELKALFQTTAGWLPETTRTGRVVDFATRPIQVIDLIPGNTTAQSAIVYMAETTFTNNAVEVGEGLAYAESALGLTEQSSPVRKIGTFIPVTDEQLEDEAQARGYLNNRLPFMLRQRLDSQILVGNGTAPNLSGFLDGDRTIQTQAKGADPVPDAVYKAMVKVRVAGRALPSAVIFHPSDWQDVRLLRTADGVYIWGSPADAGAARIWGLPVVETDAITEGTALVGDFANFTELATRRGVDVQISNSHDDYFIKGKQAVRADVRVALTVYREFALCSVTGV